MSITSDASVQFDAWNPGIKSKIPGDLLPLVTLYRPETSLVDFQNAHELSGFSGIKEAELISFRVERLLIHELLIRVTSDLSVPDGPNYEDLGINLRGMVDSIYEKYVGPELPDIQARIDQVTKSTREFMEQRMVQDLFSASEQTPSRENKPSFLRKIFGLGRAGKESATEEEPEIRALRIWDEAIENSTDTIDKYRLSAIRKVLSAIVAHRGRAPREPELIARIATNMAGNNISSELINELIDPLFQKAIEAEGFRALPIQSNPVVMNVKGASASGKSTIRPQQSQLAEKLEIEWEDFALISPDYWRKYLLDYDSLGEDAKYAAMLTGQELEIIDKKLDRYMAAKAKRGEISHLLIDRFRFDSFSVEQGASRDSSLLSRFGDEIFLFFMVTPPDETVVRAWKRGQTTGRYKAVDDLLYHNIEAFTGMPELFLSWVMTEDKKTHFEFLDNDVPFGQVPTTAAFGWNNYMIVLDLETMCDIDRFRCVNVDAGSADQVLTEQADKNKFAFIKRCIQSIKEVRFADSESGEVYAQFREGKLVWVNEQTVKDKYDADTAVTIFKNSAAASDTASSSPHPKIDVARERLFTLGQWS